MSNLGGRTQEAPPRDERSAIIEAQAARAEDLYRLDHELTDFEAFGEDDAHVDGSFAEQG